MNQKTDEVRITKTVTVVNPEGVHMRPAHMFVRLAGQFSSDIEVTKDGQSVDGKSIIGILTLAASQGTEITIGANGEDAEQAIAALTEMVSSGFADEQQ
ncbi:MAG: HPr family phosphocarrier protein [Planctomycetales bacterium]|nr:HPr family phosphocarrier protein [Planctomycetales bacterium]